MKQASLPILLDCKRIQTYVLPPDCLHTPPSARSTLCKWRCVISRLVWMKTVRIIKQLPSATRRGIWRSFFVLPCIYTLFICTVYCLFITLMWITLMATDVHHHTLMAHLFILKFLFTLFATLFFIRFVFLTLTLIRLPKTSWMFGMHTANIFSQSMAHLFTFSMMSSDEWKFWWLMESNVSIFTWVWFFFLYYSFVTNDSEITWWSREKSGRGSGDPDLR